MTVVKAKGKAGRQKTPVTHRPATQATCALHRESLIGRSREQRLPEAKWEILGSVKGSSYIKLPQNPESFPPLLFVRCATLTLKIQKWCSFSTLLFSENFLFPFHRSDTDSC